jgi:hypothetical protein
MLIRFLREILREFSDYRNGRGNLCGSNSGCNKTGKYYVYPNPVILYVVFIKIANTGMIPIYCILSSMYVTGDTPYMITTGKTNAVCV